MELARADSMPRMRLTGMLMGLNLGLPKAVENYPVSYLDGDRNLGPSLEAVRRDLPSTPARRNVVGGVNDPSTPGGLRPFKKRGMPIAARSWVKMHRLGQSGAS